MSMTFAQVPLLGDERRRELATSVGALQNYAVRFDQVWGQRAWRLVVLAVLNIADVVTTLAVIRVGGREANPVLAPMVGAWWAPVLVKSMIFGVVFGTAIQCSVRSEAANRMLRTAVAFYSMVVIWNVAVLLAH